MKAWICRNERYSDLATVIFAETRAAAHALAMFTDACSEAAWVDVSVKRIPELDDESRKQREMDWFDPEDRVALVRFGGFTCSYEMSDEDCPCDGCPATGYCSRYESMHDMDGDQKWSGEDNNG